VVAVHVLERHFVLGRRLLIPQRLLRADDGPGGPDEKPRGAFPSVRRARSHADTASSANNPHYMDNIKFAVD
jgi:hypothetical protein